jgi:hypothetical protein
VEFVNYTPFPALAYQALDQHEQRFHVVALRTTSEIRADGALQFTQAQAPLAVTDEVHGELNKSSVRQESDLSPFKPRCDVIVIGKAYAPAGRPARRFTVGIRINGPTQPRPLPPRPQGLNPTMPPSPAALAAWEKEVAGLRANSVKGPVILDRLLAVCGPRWWENGAFNGWSLTTPEPITSLPLRYEYAYGGECRIELDDPAGKHVKPKYRLTTEQRRQHPDGPEKAPVAHRACEMNPVGMGYAEPWYLKAKKLKRVRAPQIDQPDEPVREFGKPYPVQGFGVITKAWLPRRKHCGTIDDAFVKSGKPLPDDFDFAFWNGAHPDLQVPWLVGNEEITLTNLCPHNAPGATRDRSGNTLLRFVLPGHQPFVLVRYEDGAMVPTQVELDTLVIEPDERKVSCVYRLLLTMEPVVRVLEARLIFKEPEIGENTGKPGGRSHDEGRQHAGLKRGAGHG